MGKLIRLLLSVVCVSCLYCNASAQSGKVYLEPLFEYPVAPDELVDLEARSNYIISNFWRQFDFDKKFVGQSQLNHAFGVFVSAMPWANKKVVVDAVDHLLDKLKKKPGLMYQFTVAAEENLYGPRADYWIDDVYLKFLKAIVKQKKIPAAGERKYANQYAALSNTIKGNPMPEVMVNSENGMSRIIPSGITIIQFGNMNNADSRQEKLLLELDSDIKACLASGKLDLWYVEVPSVPEGMDYSELESEIDNNWHCGVSSKDLASKIDIRRIPSFYLIDGDNRIILKNVRAADIKSALRELYADETD